MEKNKQIRLDNSDALALNIANNLMNNSMNIVIVESEKKMLELEQNLSFLLPAKTSIFTISDDEACMLYFRQSLIGTRMKKVSALQKLLSMNDGVAIVNYCSLFKRLPPLKVFDGCAMHIAAGKDIDMDKFLRHLIACGYERCDEVREPFHCARKGEIVDFSYDADYGYRLMWNDVALEKINTLNLISQLPEKNINEINILPLFEFVLNDKTSNYFMQNTKAQSLINYPLVMENVLALNHTFDYSFYLPLFFPETSNLFDFIKPDSRFFITAKSQDAIEDFSIKISSNYQNIFLDFSTISLSDIMLSKQEIYKNLFTQDLVLYEYFG